MKPQPLLLLACLAASGRVAAGGATRHPRAPSAASIIARMVAHYDSARSYSGTIETRIITPAYAGKTVIHADAETNGRGALTRSRIEMTSIGRTTSTRMVRVDDGRTLWTYSPGTGGYWRETRRRDRLSNLFRPFLESARKFVPRLRVRQAILGGRKVYELSGRGKGMGRLTLYADRSTCALVKANAVGPTGDIMTLAARCEQWNSTVAAANFIFTPPPDSRLLPAPRPGGVYGKPDR